MRVSRLLPLVAALAIASCRISQPGRPPPPPPPAPEPARSAEGALVELGPDDLPPFGDDLDHAGLDEALARSLAALDRIAAADPGRTFAFGKERVSIARMRATLVRFRDLLAARPDPASLAEAIRREFRVFRSVGDGTGRVLFTGYYLPELNASMSRGGAYTVPLHRAPHDLVVARVRDFPTALSSDVVGRVEDGRLVPYPTRAEIARGGISNVDALCWADSVVDLFFAEIQGSAVVRFPDGSRRVATYAGKNGHRYEAVGAELVRRGALRREEVSMQAIRAWLAANPAERDAVLATNPSYVFFRFADDAIGALGVPVTPGRSIAADARVFPKGALAFIEAERPVDETSATMRPFSRFVLDQDAGGAIRTSARVDVYFGSGAYAANAAGRMKQPGRLHYLLLREAALPAGAPVAAAR
jgi:membrane-bound lytic murein transglycosylase A